MAEASRQLLMFTLSTWAMLLVVPPARSADSMRRLAKVDRTVTCVALRLCTLLTTTTLGLRCMTECSVREKLSLTRGPVRTRPTFLTRHLIGLLMATTPMLGAPTPDSVAHSAAAPLELAGLAMRTTLRGTLSIPTKCGRNLLANLSVRKLSIMSLWLRTCTIIDLLQEAGMAEMCRLSLPFRMCSTTWLLRGRCCLVTPSPVTTPTCETMVVASEVGGVLILLSMLLTWQCIPRWPLKGLMRTLEVCVLIVCRTTRPISWTIGVLEVRLCRRLMLLLSWAVLLERPLMTAFTVSWLELQQCLTSVLTLSGRLMWIRILSLYVSLSVLTGQALSGPVITVLIADLALVKGIS